MTSHERLFFLSAYTMALYGRKTGPDPASIHAAMVGGIAANNASGMCCGTAENSYKTLDSMRLILADGTVLDTADPKSEAQFQQTHAQLLQDLSDMAASIKHNEPLASRIAHKYKMKNTTGYSLNALVDFTDPFDILEHLFDPQNLLNPGVILNQDAEVHLKNLKPMPAAHDSIDKCIECGFREPACVSVDLTLTPRQRIVVYRHIKSLERTGQEPHVAASLNKAFQYAGNETCATNGLCAIRCSVDIDTGKLIKTLRTEKSAPDRNERCGLPTGWAVSLRS